MRTFLFILQIGRIHNLKKKWWINVIFNIFNNFFLIQIIKVTQFHNKFMIATFEYNNKQ